MDNAKSDKDSLEKKVRDRIFTKMRIPIKCKYNINIKWFYIRLHFKDVKALFYMY